MAKQKEQFDNNLELKVTERFKSDIKAQFSPKHTVPPEVDRAILDKASQKLARPRKQHQIFRWAGVFASAAAVIIFACVLVNHQKPATQSIALVEVSTDIDKNGEVNILDAFKLAKQIQSPGELDKKWDINGDGNINQGDVDLVASAAVSLNKGVFQ